MISSEPEAFHSNHWYWQSEILPPVQLVNLITYIRALRGPDCLAVTACLFTIDEINAPIFKT